MTAHPLLGVDTVPETEPYLRTVGEVFRSFGDQDSGCVAHGIQLPDGQRWFVKEAVTGRGQRSLDRAWDFHRVVRHPAIVPQLHRIAVGGRRTAVVMPWHEGEILYDRTARARFRALPLPRVHHALDRILDAHLAVEAAGQVAVDLYDGAFLYDFDGHEIHLIDLDEYRPGPFVLAEDRLPGSTRFMAPEEWRRGAEIGIRTTVHALGRTIRLLLDAGPGEDAFRGTAAQLAVVGRATRSDPAERYGGVRELVVAWRAVS
ncbi:serine/threonine protein kinase [Streptomyces sp. SID13726]|uniref:serine/threonine protein kinase n=1 Tax=Streptomyces sp. SID13726 TaxID=2706058 RepID=UPI0013BCEF50|nr:serine/threonine protein kinase [Streptomyces sp. SID13726]NEB04702.1 serine/threonine protein kinase [Streptomyces sp. SID13726]